MSELPEYITDRVFDAPREMVWRAWTDPELLARWYGPGVETIIHKFDLKPGGMWLNEMKWGENSMLSKAIFKEVAPLERLVWHHHSSTDSEWNTVANPKMPDWPRILLTTVTFEDDGPKTRVRLIWAPLKRPTRRLPVLPVPWPIWARDGKAVSRLWTRCSRSCRRKIPK